MYTDISEMSFIQYVQCQKLVGIDESLYGHPCFCEADQFLTIAPRYVRVGISRGNLYASSDAFAAIGTEAMPFLREIKGAKTPRQRGASGQTTRRKGGSGRISVRKDLSSLGTILRHASRRSLEAPAGLAPVPRVARRLRNLKSPRGHRDQCVITEQYTTPSWYRS
jgi:hypothetical protein